jgi:large subunit ribosomal protein L28
MAPLHIYVMAKQCDITGKKTQIGGRYSNRTRATQFNPCGKTRRQPNLQKKRIYVPELGKAVTVNVSTKALRTIAKNGAYETLKKAGLI